MRRILVEAARRKQSTKRGGGRHQLALADIEHPATDDPDRWLLLDDALSRLAEEDLAAAKVAQLRLFTGLSVEDAAAALGLSRATAFRHWMYARAWLQATLQESDKEH